jgi:hypothetical protein
MMRSPLVGLKEVAVTRQHLLEEYGAIDQRLRSGIFWNRHVSLELAFALCFGHLQNSSFRESPASK